MNTRHTPSLSPRRTGMVWTLIMASAFGASALTSSAAPMDATTLADFDFSAAQQTRTQALIDNGTLELQRVLTGPESGYRHMGWPVATRLPDGRAVVLIRHLRDHSAYASYTDNARRVIWSDDGMATWLPSDALTAEPPFGRNLDDTPTKYDYQGMQAISWAYASGTSNPRLVAVTAQQDENNKTPRSRVYLSDDRGATWSEQTDALAAMPAGAVHSGPNMARHPEFGLIVPFGQQTGSGANRQNYIASSADAGATWQIRTWTNKAASRSIEPALATWGPGHMVLIGRERDNAYGYDASSGKHYYTQHVYKHTPGAAFADVAFTTARTNIAGNGKTPTEKGKNAYEAHDTADVIHNPVTGRIEMIQSSRWGNGAENPLPADPADVDTVNNSLNIWSIDPVDLLNGGTTWRFDGNLVERQGIILGGAAGTYGDKGNKDGYHPGGSIVDEAAGRQHIFVYVGVYTQYANTYRISRPLDTYAFRAACGLPALPAPAITGVTVSGSTATITGINFTALKEVLVAGKSTTIVSSTITEIKATLPAGVTATTGGDVTVRSDHGITTGISNISNLPPAISAISYDAIWPGNLITITGVNLDGVAKVFLGDIEITSFVSKTDTQVVLTVPDGVTGGGISIQTASGGTVPLPISGSYTVAIKPFDLTPLITTQPAVIGYHPVDLAGSAQGTPAPAFKWQVRPGDSGDWADIDSSPDYQGADTKHLNIINTAGKNGWQYRYAATNNTEDVHSNATTLLLLDDTLPSPSGIVAAAGESAPDLYIADAQAHVVQKITQSDQKASVFAGGHGQPGATDGTASAARLNAPRGLAIDASGALIVADTGNSRLRVIADGSVSSVATTLNKPRAIAAHDGSGDIYVADTGNHLIRKIGADGTASIVAGAGAPGFANGSGPAAQFRSPSGIAMDIAGNLYIADTGNHIIRYINMTTGSVSTFAGGTTSGTANGAVASARFKSPEGIAVDANGDVFIADTGNSLIREIHSGTVTTIAGQLPGIAGFKDGTGTNAWFDNPRGVIVAEDGNLYVADTGNAVIRRITAENEVTTLPINVLTGNSGTSGGGGNNNSGGNGGGGAPSWWFAAALLALLSARALANRRR